MRTILRFVARGVIRRKRLRRQVLRFVEATSTSLGLAADEHYSKVYEQFADSTRIPKPTYLANLQLVDSFRDVEGCVVECGVWRGGMIAGIAAVLGPEREYHLFDSFQGLPDAALVDGSRALEWERENTAEGCRTEEGHAHQAMQAAGAKRYVVHAGWFRDTMPDVELSERIAILRLDSDWYSSIAECLNHLYERVTPGGLIILDDYYTWDGCSRAVHDFLSANVSTDRIRERMPRVAYLVKSSTGTPIPIDPRRGVPVQS